MDLPQHRADDRDLLWGERTTGRVLGASADASTRAAIALIIGSLAASWGIATAVGGANAVAPHWFYVPIFFAAIRFGSLGALVTSLVAVMLSGPLLPAVTSSHLAQPVSDWGTRGAFFIALGQVLAFSLRRPSLAWSAAVQNLRIERGLRHALIRGEFEVHYQSISDIRAPENHVSGAEALVRWRHPKEGLVLPEEFIRVAETTGQIHEIGDFVLERVCRQLVEWTEVRGSRRFGVAVNLSARQLSDKDLPERVARCFAKTGVDPACVSFEITETAAMADVDGSIVRLGALRDLGTRIAIDDFGIGHSSLAYVHRLPIDAIKIDQSFTHRITGHPDAARLVHSIILLTHSLELDAVAEGVETSEQLTMLKQMGCDYAQGFHLGSPAPPEHITSMLEGEQAPRQRRSPPARRSVASSAPPVLKVVAGQAPG